MRGFEVKHQGTRDEDEDGEGKQKSTVPKNFDADAGEVADDGSRHQSKRECGPEENRWTDEHEDRRKKLEGADEKSPPRLHAHPGENID